MSASLSWVVGVVACMVGIACLVTGGYALLLEIFSRRK
jgi:hypothetical protein